MDALAARPCPSLCRGFLTGLVVAVCATVLALAFLVEPFQVPTGSMAPAILGHHRACTCPNCGMPVVVGRHPSDKDGQAGPRRYAKAFCPNCGQQPVPAGKVPETTGDHILVNKAAFALRGPRRWEIIVFRLFGGVFIKRVGGLPGEELLLKGGDVYADGELARKSFAQAKAMRLPVFEQRYTPSDGWRQRWEGLDGSTLALDGRQSPRTLTYRNFLADGKCAPLTDEYAYNGGLIAGTETVHDFLIDTTVEVRAGHGSLAIRLCDGRDWVEVALPVGQPAPVEARAWPMDDASRETALGRGRDIGLQPGRRYRVEMAFVDRRLNLSVDGRPVLEEIDLPEPGVRRGVERPVQVRADGVAVTLHAFRLDRDVHYTQVGRQAVGGQPVRLGAGQYFVLGDNSPNSEDSRFWPGGGAVSEGQLIGRPLLTHLPSRTLRWQAAGRAGQCQVPDWDRIHWLR